MIQGPPNRFVLSNSTFTLDCEPTNWGDMEMGLSRDFLGVNREATSELRFDGAAAVKIRNEYDAGRTVFLTVYRQNDTLTYDLLRSFKSDYKTYVRNLLDNSVRLQFMASTVRDEIEANRGVKYEIPFMGHYMNYTGVNRDRTTLLSTLVGSCVRMSPSNFMLSGSIQREYTDEVSFDNMSVVANVDVTLTIEASIGRIRLEANKKPSIQRLYLSHIRWYPGGSGFEIIETFSLLTSVPGSGNTFFYNYDTTTEISATVNMLAGDEIVLFNNGSSYTEDSFSWVRVLEAKGTRIKAVSTGSSYFTNHRIEVLPLQLAFSAILGKMCTPTPRVLRTLPVGYGVPAYKVPYVNVTIDWKLPPYNASGGTNIPVLASSSSMVQTVDPILTVSFDDLLKCARCLYGADYDLTDFETYGDETLTIGLPGTFFTGTKAEDVEPIRFGEITHDPEHVYGTVEVGYESDEDVENGMNDPMCKNVFRLNDTSKEVLDLVSPFKASPYTIEAYLEDKRSSTSTTKESDDDVFLFCVTSFFETLGSTLVKQSGSTLFNIPFSPMRVLIANGRYLGVSSSTIEFLSTDRTADYTSNFGEEIREDTPPASLLSLMGAPLFLPQIVDFDTEARVWSRTELNGNVYKYFTVTNENTDETLNVYIKDITLPMTREGLQKWLTVVKYDIP